MTNETRPLKQITRRSFQTTVGALAFGTQIAPVHSSQSSRLRLASIGVGGRGGANLRAVAQDPDVEIVALCDVDGKNLDAAHRLFPDAATFRDFRQLYRETDDFDGVVVSTCEHTHAYATLPALKRNKHVYCEKPLTHNVHEARAITEAAQKANVATQMGTQIHASENYRRVVELIQNGVIGDVSEAHVWVGRAWGLQSEQEARENKDIVYVTERPTQAMQPPEYLDWDLWLGPAPYRPYHEVYFPGPKWYRWWDFGNGTMSDLGSHWNDLPYWALQLDAPLSVAAEGDEPHPEIAPASMSATYEYGPREGRPGCKLVWYQGTYKPKLWQDGKIPQWNSGVLFVGSEGMLLSDYRKHVLLPEEKFAHVELPDPYLPRVKGHHEEWLAACRDGTATGSRFDYAGPLTEANHLGNVAFRAATKIKWDAVGMRVTNSDLANRFCGRTPREGWSLD